MSWARLDDRYDDHPKVKAATRRDPLATTLHPQSITSCARHETDGLIDPWWIEERAPVKRKREAAIAVLVELRLWDVLPAGESRTFTDSKGWEVVVGPFEVDRLLVHDYLEYNDSSAYHADKRARDAARKRKPHSAESGGNPDGVRAESERTPLTESMDSAHPDPTRPDPALHKESSSPHVVPSGTPPRTSSLAEDVVGILQRGIDGLTTDKHCKRPTVAAITAALAECGADEMTAKGVAIECRSIAQSQNHAPNIAALFAQKLRKAA